MENKSWISTSIKSSYRKKDGFISIVAIAILALLAIFGITIQLAVMDTVENVKSLNNYYSSRDINDGVVEFALNELASHEAGYNLELECKYGKYADANADNVNGCASFDAYGSGKDLKIKLSVKGRAETTDKVKTAKCAISAANNFNQDCYVSPFPGTGNAGSDCKLYDPVMLNEDGAINTMPQNVAGIGNTDNLDHPCNWNKLIFGSSLLDRVQIPFYYDNGSDIINPFHENTPQNLKATKFILRLRTPCIPCGKVNSDGTVPNGTRNCTGLPEPLLCANNDRYVLKSGDLDGGSENQIVVQWKLSGKCDSNNDESSEEACLVVADPKNTQQNSAIFEKLINDKTENSSSIVLKNNSEGRYTNIFPAEVVTFLGDNPKLSNFLEPVLSLFLSSTLIDNNNKTIPYLEYQVLTNEPIANPTTTIKIDVTIDDNSYTKIIHQEIKKDLIDFAVQN